MSNEAEDAEREAVRNRVKEITTGWLAHALNDFDIYPTNGDVSWRSRKINDELTDLILERDKSQRHKLLAEIEGKGPKERQPETKGKIQRMIMNNPAVDQYCAGFNRANAVWRAVLREME